MSTDEFLPGEVVIVPFPYTDLSSSKRRPALVLTSEPFNSASEDIVLCAITSRLSNSANSLAIGPDDLEEGRLPRLSRVKVGKVVSVKKDIVVSRLGRLKPAVFDRVIREFEAVFA